MAYDVICEANKHVVVAVHDEFVDPKSWYYLGEDSHYDKNVMLNTHLYQVFGEKYKSMTCEEHEKVAAYREPLKEANKKLWTVVGEWSFATPKPCDKNREALALQQIGVWESTSSEWFFWAHKNEQKWYSWSFEDSCKKGWLKPNHTYKALC